MSLPTPYYEEPGITIYHGDCLQLLPYLSRMDLVLTDPPYGIGRDGQRASNGMHGGRKAHQFLRWDINRPHPIIFERLRAISNHQIIWGGNYFADFLPPTMGWLVWDKGQRITQSDGELAWTSYQRALRIFTLNRMALQQDGAEHPTQKPIALMNWCLSLATDCQSILDPFMGSGTTLLAAKNSGRTCIGIEIEEKYCQIAVDRLRQAVLPLPVVAQ